MTPQVREAAGLHWGVPASRKLLPTHSIMHPCTCMCALTMLAYPSRYPNPNMGRAYCFGEKTSLQQSIQTRDPFWVQLDCEPRNASLYLLDPNLGWGRPTVSRRGERRGDVCAHPCRRRCSSKPPCVPCRSSHLGSSAGIVLARPDDRECITGGVIYSESFAGGEICTGIDSLI